MDRLPTQREVAQMPIGPTGQQLQTADPGRVVAMCDALRKATADINAAIFAADHIIAEADEGQAGQSRAKRFGLVAVQLDELKRTLDIILLAYAADYRVAKKQIADAATEPT